MDYKSSYPESLNKNDEKDKAFEKFNKAFEEDIVPIWNDPETIDKLKIAAFYNYITNNWAEFISRLEGNQ